MSLIAVIGILILIGVILWGVSVMPWIDASFKKVIYVIIVVFVVIWLLQAFGLLPALSKVRIA